MKTSRIFIASLFFLILGITLAGFSDLISNKSRYTKEIESTLHQKTEIVHRYFDRMKNLEEPEVSDLITSAEKNGIVLLSYRSDSLQFWSSNSIPVYPILNDTLFEGPIIKLFNSYYYVEKYQQDSMAYIGLIDLYNQYDYQNEFLNSGFSPDFRVAEDATISLNEEEGFAVRDQDQKYLFSIIPEFVSDSANPRLIIATLLFFLGLILFGLLIIRVLTDYYQKKGRLAIVLAIVAGILILRIIQLRFAFYIGAFLLFDPYTYAESSLAPSLGDLLINALLVFFTALMIYKTCRIQTEKYAVLSRNIILQILTTLLFILFYLNAHYFSYSLIFNSKINFQPNAISQLTIYSLIGFLINGINYSAAGILFIWLLYITDLKSNITRIITVFILTSAAVFAGLIVGLHYPMDLSSIIFFYLFTGMVGAAIYAGRDLTRYTPQVLFLLLFSIYSFIFITVQEQRKEAVTKVSLALSLANEHDPVAEYLFEDVSRQLEKDTVILNQFCRNKMELPELRNYVKNKYFSGFWNKYNLIITPCRPEDNVLIEDVEPEWYHCYSFFDQIISDMGVTLPDSRFFYLDLYTGRISYLGIFPYKAEGEEEVTLFFELFSRLTTDFLGYPELLLDERLHEDRLIEKYSYAKYYKGKLVSKYGDFSYSLNATLFGRMTGDYLTVKLDGYTHLLYRSEPDSLIVLSLPSIKFIDLLIGFSYIFLFYYLCMALILAIRNVQRPDIRFLRNLRSKIQFSTMMILLLSLILIAASTIWLSMRNYRQQQNEVLQEKLQSVLVELSHKLSNEDHLSQDWSADKYNNLNQLLIKFSDVFFTDINLYSPEGDLLATSRFEIFDMGLQGEKMNPLAFYKLSKEKQSQFIHRESIGKLKFQSAYVPFFNAGGKLLAYLNLPYFTKQKDLQASLSALIVTIVNIYVILILITIVLTILISDQITRPLELLQLRFRELKVGNKYEQIVYKRNDEIGNLVEEYNRMVLELERSINLLTRSERESAWREMAKQIAHEIKNPLTPMRLSVQQLNKVWVEKPDDFETYLTNVTHTLIEQIDNLSAIASEFSNFAKMPVAKFEKTDLMRVLKQSVKLFDSNPAVSINLHTKADAVFINADGEQLSRVFINIIKNGIQSIPEDRKGQIEINTAIEETTAVVRISDNGKGIPEEIRSKLFMPNFTTKTSGMGLGLAIVKNIVEQMNGDIKFETRVNEGSVFILHLPLFDH